MTAWFVAALAGVGTLWWWRPLPRMPSAHPVRAPSADPGWMWRWRWWWSLCAGVAGACFVSGTWALPAGLAAGVSVWVFIGRTEPAAERRRREAMARDLPGLVHLLASALTAGGDVGDAVRLVCEAYPGPASDALRAVPPRLALGVDAASAWQPALDDPRLAPLGRAMVRARRSGASVTHEVSRLADELGQRSRFRAEERARAVGVKAAVPLGLCLIPSFVLLGVVPLVVSLLQSLAL
jgi:Flp pilus assembly protein TadB